MEFIIVQNININNELLVTHSSSGIKVKLYPEINLHQQKLPLFSKIARKTLIN